jgi:hypothetical protein
MDFMNRGTSRPSQAPAGEKTESNAPSSVSRKVASEFKGLQVFNVSLLFSVTILLIALALGLRLLGPNTASESKYVDTSKMQAVFLNNGQVYFGKITALNQNFVALSDIYYLRIVQQVQPEQGAQTEAQGEPILVKLGCELHRPENSMVINRDQVTFWENLKDENGENTIPGAVKKYVKDNPNGQECAAETATDASTTPATTPTNTTNR